MSKPTKTTAITKANLNSSNSNPPTIDNINKAKNANKIARKILNINLTSF